jgi:hypothetical protein
MKFNAAHACKRVAEIFGHIKGCRLNLSVILAMLRRQVSADIFAPRFPVGSAQKPVCFFIAHNQFLLCIPLEQSADSEGDVSEVERVG